MKHRVSGVPYEVELAVQQRKNNLLYISFALGFVLCALVAVAMQRNEKAAAQSAVEGLPKDIIEAYRMGVKDALKTNPASWELEQACLELWANKQVAK